MPPKNLARLLDGYRAFCQGDLAQAFSVLDAAVVWEGSHSHEPCVGRSAVESSLTHSFGEGFPFELTEVVAGGDHIMLGFREVAKRAGKRRFFAVVEIEDGKVVGIHQYDDRARALEHINSPAL